MQTKRLIPLASAALIALTLMAPVGAEMPLVTEWGTPDLSGVWDSGTVTPLERPKSMADRTHFTEEEAAALRGTGVERVLKSVENSLEGKLTGELNEVWLAPGEEVVRSLRNSLVIDPPNGKIPFTRDGRKRWFRQFQLRAPNAPAHAPEVRHISDRCLMTGMLYQTNPFYLNYHQIIQTPDHVVIHSELMNETRIIPLDGRAQLDPSLKQWSGSSRGHWEGETLVVEATNFNGKSGAYGSTEDLRVVERFTRVDEETIDYQATFSDPASYKQPWTLENTLRAMEGPIYEYACAEANYGLRGILRGARVQEQEAAEAAEARRE